MEGFDPFDSFGPEVASSYDEDLRGDEAETVEFLAEHAGTGPVLEFAIGTGRIALPLSERGIRVDGIEQSTAMVDQLRAKPGAGKISITIGDMSAVELPEQYALVYLGFNTIHNLLTQDGQVRCFENAARHLDSDGVFVVETGVPWRGPREGSYIEVPKVTMGEVRISPHTYDAMTQILDISHLRLTTEGIQMSPLSLRLVYPSELDLMARIAGLRLRHRWGGWKQEPFLYRAQPSSCERVRAAIDNPHLRIRVLLAGLAPATCCSGDVSAQTLCRSAKLLVGSDREAKVIFWPLAVSSFRFARRLYCRHEGRLPVSFAALVAGRLSPVWSGSSGRRIHTDWRALSRG